MMDPKAFHSISYGLFLLSTKADGKDNGCIINSVLQVASEPSRIMISVNKSALSCETIQNTKEFNLSVLTSSAPFELFRHFGFQSGRAVAKFQTWAEATRCNNGLLRLTKWANAFFSCRVIAQEDCGSHIAFFADVIEASVLSDEASVTYKEYLENIKPKPAPKETTQTVWRCEICGYEWVGEELPDDFVCPLCQHGKQDFSKIESKKQLQYESEKTKMKKWKCLICGEIVISEERPDKCPLCKAPGEKFVEVVEDEMTWAAEHVVGVGKKDVPEEIIEGLRANFNGECSEVGMYLAMARVAHREGYPEIGLYWEKAAWEEAEHAAKFAELLGEVITDSTEKNLAMRVEAENGATAGKFELAKKAKALNLDAIHDTVHEMARDEARHGKAFAGLLKRYFGK